MTYLALTEELKNKLISNFKLPVDQLVKSGVIQDPNLNGINSSESVQIKNDHRNKIIQQGRADFDVDSDGLTAIQKVDLYGYYYFQMHFTSSYVFFLSETDFLKNVITNKHICFIDVGCGPFTSGLAFNSILSKPENMVYKSATYIGIDTSNKMLEKGQNVFKSISIPNFQQAIFNTDMKSITDGLHLMINQQEEIIFFLNYSYLFASHSLVVEEFVSFTNTILTQFCNTARCKLIVLQQNPKTDNLNIKWNDYANRLPALNRKDNFPKLLGFQFDDVLNSTKYQKPNMRVMCDILKSF